jgi:hypothetical protein
MDRDPVSVAAVFAKRILWYEITMRYAIAVIFALLSGTGLTPTVAAEPQGEGEQDTWKSDIAAARARAETYRQEKKAELERRRLERLRNPPSSDDLERAREREVSSRALSDSSLQKGDIVSTEKGLFMFVGEPEKDHGPADFAPLGRQAPRR